MEGVAPSKSSSFADYRQKLSATPPLTTLHDLQLTVKLPGHIEYQLASH
jgi:hypothetical protein